MENDKNLEKDELKEIGAEEKELKKSELKESQIEEAKKGKLEDNKVEKNEDNKIDKNQEKVDEMKNKKIDVMNLAKDFMNRGKLDSIKKKVISKLLMIFVVVHLILFIFSFFTGIFSSNTVIRNIIIGLLVIFDLGFSIYIVMIVNKSEDTKSQEKTKKDFNPILAQYILKNSLEYNDNMLILEMKSLIERNLVTVKKDKNKVEFQLISRDKFKRVEGLEKMDRETINNYSTDEIPSYENLFVTKILFPFEDVILLDDFKKKLKDGYYKERLELSSFIMEKMLVFEMEKDNMIVSGNAINKFSILLVVNVIITLFYLSAFHVNIFLLLANLLNLAVSIILLKNEKIFSYLFTDSVQEDINRLEKAKYNDNGVFSKNLCDNFFEELEKY